MIRVMRVIRNEIRIEQSRKNLENSNDLDFWFLFLYDLRMPTLSCIFDFSMFLRDFLCRTSLCYLAVQRLFLVLGCQGAQVVFPARK